MHDYGLELLLFCSSQVNIYAQELRSPLTVSWRSCWFFFCCCFLCFLFLFSRIVWVLKAIKPLKRMKYTIQNVMISMPHPISLFSQRINNNFYWKHLAQKLTSVLKIFIISMLYCKQIGTISGSLYLIQQAFDTLNIHVFSMKLRLRMSFDFFFGDWQISGVHRSIMTSFV